VDSANADFFANKAAKPSGNPRFFNSGFVILLIKKEIFETMFYYKCGLQIHG